jgi:gas vesicle protein
MKLQNITNVNEIFLNTNKTLNFLDELMYYIDDQRNEDDLSDKKLPLFKQFYGKLFENLKNLYDEISEKNEGNVTQINNIIDKSKKFLKYVYSQVLRIKEQIQDNFIKIKEYEEKVENIIMNIDKQIKDYSLIIGK